MWLVLPATAEITGSAHDLGGRGYTMPDGRICVACHTPHSAISTEAPIWNHEVSAGGHTPYDSGTIHATDLSNPAGISLMCLSCHDGSVAVDSFGGNTGSTTIGGSAFLDVDLSDDHPISFTYNTALAGNDGQLHDPVTMPSGLGDNIDVDMLFGSGDDQFECASCHDVHNGPTVASSPLLVKSMAASDLCFTCHNK
jgi:predicted CXXCH cytochrome family protein